MGQTRRRLGADGRARYTAYYEDVRGRRRSAGTFARKRDSDIAWQRAEAQVAEGRASDPARGRQTFRRYVEEEWLPNHVMEATTREGYTYSIYANIIGTFGPMRMITILPSHVREWVAACERGGMSPASLRLNKSILSAIFTTALNDQVTALHPCRGVRTPPIPRRPLRIITPEEFDTFYAHLPDDSSRLLVETAIASGMRWGELAELRPTDLDLNTGIVTVSRAVVEVGPDYHPHGGRFLVKDYPKDREWRRLKLSPQVVDRLAHFIAERGIGRDDLVFVYVPPEVARPDPVQDPEPSALTAPNARGRQYRHGTLSGYSAGRCRCSRCRYAYARYRAERRAAGSDSPRHRRTWQSDGHIPHRWFRESVLKPALAASGIDVDVKMHGLRHAHASWLLAGGADLQVVKERLGHGSITTTERYLHTLPDADNTAVEAFLRVRDRSAPPTRTGSTR